MAKTGSKKGSSKGNGYLFKRGSIYYLQYDINNKRKTVSLKTRSKEEAEEKSKKLLEPVKQIKSESDVIYQVAKAKNIYHKANCKLSEVWQLFEFHPSRKQCGEKTQNLYKYRISEFIKWVNSSYPQILSLTDIDDKISQEYASKLSKIGKSGKTYNETISLLNKLIKTLLECEEKKNPFRKANIAKQDDIPTSRKEFSEEEITLILNSFTELKYKDINELEIMFYLGTWTGLRMKDCALMKWSDVNFSESEIKLIPSKSRKFKTYVNIPMHPLLKEKLILAKEWKNNEYILPKVANRYIKNSVSIVKAVKRILKHSGFDSVNENNNENRQLKANIYGFHSLRHSFVSFCAKSGVPLALVQEIVGHKNPAMTKHYTHYDKQSRIKAINSLNMLSDSSNTKQKIIERLDLLSEKQFEKVLEFINTI